MTWYSKAALFALKTAAEPALEKLGEKVGEAVGTRFGRRIDPKGAKDEPDKITEDERTG